MSVKENDYITLTKDASQCRLCPDVYHRLTYLNQKNGDITSPLMFIGEAPGFVRDRNERLKAFHGNQSGTNFENLLAHIGLRRNNVFVTNAMLHTPIRASKTEFPDYGFIQIRPPRTQEIINCSNFLRRQVELVDPEVICTLGRAALNAVCDLYQLPYMALGVHVAREHTIQTKTGTYRYLFPLYHTSPNVTSSIRSYEQMEVDFENLRGLLNRLHLLPSGVL